jgi:hypothetical protein
MEAILQWLGLAAKFITRLPTAAIAVASGFALFAPRGWLSFLGIRELFDKYHEWVGIAFVLAVSTLVVAVVPMLWNNLLSEWWHGYNRHRLVKWTLKHLTDDEKERLQPFLTAASVNYGMADGVSVGLVQKGILFCPAPIGTVAARAYNIQPPVRHYLLKHPELLKFSGEPASRANAPGNAHSWMAH